MSGPPTQPSAPNDAKPPEADAFLRRLEGLARKLLGAKFENADDLWQLQIDLLQLQRDVQAAITLSKRRRDSQFETLQALRRARWLSRRLGDALAWVLLGLNEQIIRPLAHNRRIPISQDGHGSRGVLGIASYFAGEEWGFPVLHDVTDCLRIGDVTFVKPGDPSSVKTIEVKTQLKSERRTEEGQTEFLYQVTAMAATPPMDELRHRQVEYEPPERVTSDRVNRQLERMTRAVIHQRAQSGELTHIPGEAPLLTTHISHGSSHWKTLRRVIRNSRRQGYAAEIVDGAFLYVSLYDHGGVDENAVTNSTLTHDVEPLALLPPHDKMANSLIIFSIPPDLGDGFSEFLPFYLYDIPKQAKYDIVHGRLLITVLVNPSRLVVALEAEGFDVTDTSGRGDLSPGSLVIASRVEDEQGNPFWAELRSVDSVIRQAVFEFKSLDYVIETVQSSWQAAQFAASRFSATTVDRGQESRDG